MYNHDNSYNEPSNEWFQPFPEIDDFVIPLHVDSAEHDNNLSLTQSAESDTINRILDEDADIYNQLPSTPNDHSSLIDADTATNTGPYVDGASDVGNARLVIQMRPDDFRYVLEQNQFYIWDGRRWKASHPTEMTTIVRSVGDQIRQNRSTNPRYFDVGLDINRLHSVSGMNQCVEALRGEPRIQVGKAFFDRELYLLNVNNGTIDLRDGTFRDHSKADYVTGIVPITYNSDAQCPMFDRFIERVVPNAELRDYMQQAIGYILTGSTKEQCMFILHGPGGTGKSTLMELLQAMLGADYAQTAPMTIFQSKADKSATNDIARMRGKRLIVTSETESYQMISGAQFKNLMGQDTLVARKMYVDFDEFVPQFKIVMGTNNLPRLSVADSAVARRIQIWPMREVISGSERIQDLTGRLLSEAPGILNWAISGARKWHEAGELIAPPIVRQEVERYMHQSNDDDVTQFIEARCEADENLSCRSADLFSAYCDWRRSAGLRYQGQKKFGERLTELGYGHHRTSNATFRTGLTLTTTSDAP